MLKRRVALITSLAAKMQYEAIREAGTYGGGLADFIEENYPRFSVSNRTDTRATFRNGRITEMPAEMSNEEKEEAWAEYQERNRPQMTDEERYREESGRGLLFNKSKNLTTRADGYPIADDNETVDVVEIPENAIPDFKTRADLRNWLIGKFEEIGHTTIQSTGANVDFNKTAAQRVVKNSRQRRNNMAYPEIEKVVSGAKYSGFRLADERHKEKVRGQDVYHSGITYKGIPYSVEFYVDVPLNIEATDNFAGNKIRQIRIAPTETLLTSDRQNRAANNPSDAIHNISLAVLRGKVNPARQENGLLFSKAVEENEFKKVSDNRVAVDEQKQHNEEYNRKAKDYFGTTRNLNEAGYILTDGSLLDLSGKNQGGRGGYRALDHLDVAEALENADMYDFINSGNIRYLPESDTIQIADIPTAAQYQTLSSIINKAGGEVTVQLISDAHNDSFSDYYREYEDLTLSKLKKDINAFYKGAGVQEITQYYQGQIADNVIDGHEVIDGFDENASNDAFVRTKEGRVEHGYITDELAKQIGSSKGGEIRLYNDLDKHIDKGRKKYILSQGYADLIDFVDDTISNWEKIYKGSDKSFLITKSKNKDNIVAVKLERGGKYYKISTAFIGRNGYLKNKKALAERAAANQLLTKSPDAFSGASAIDNITLTRENVNISLC